MKNILVINLFLFFGIGTNGQPSREGFVNQVYKSFVFEGHKPYHLFENCGRFFYSPDLLHTDLKKEILQYIPDSVFEELCTKIKSDTFPLKWRQAYLENAKCISDGGRDLSIGTGFTTYPPLSNIDQESEIKKKRVLLAKKRPFLYYFSRPIFDQHEEYSLIRVAYLCGPGCGSECIYLFERIKGEWVKMLEFSCESSLHLSPHGKRKE